MYCIMCVCQVWELGSTVNVYECMCVCVFVVIWHQL